MHIPPQANCIPQNERGYDDGEDHRERHRHGEEHWTPRRDRPDLHVA